MKKLLLTLSMILGLNSSPLMAELTQTQLNATLGIVTNFILDDGITHNGTNYGTVTSPYTGRVWLDRNLGASEVCSSFDDALCYGDYYQWGRDHDGHQESNSSTTTTLATDVNAAGSSFILNSNSPPYDWVLVDSNGSIRFAKWSATDGSSICPIGFRVPTSAELQAETTDNGVTNRDTAFSNFLKLPSAGARSKSTGVLSNQNSGYLWAGSVVSIYSSMINFDSSSASIAFGFHPSGFPVRCIKD